MKILVTGGAGYIGSVTVELLREAGEGVVVLDNLCRGHRDAVPESVAFYEGDIGDRELVARIVREHEVTECIHFAAFAYVGESAENPGLYFENNVGQGIALLSALQKAGVETIIFSSSCATYGPPRYIPIDESHPQAPANPYGWSKLVFEKMLESYATAYGLKFVALRYFNAAGATACHGERHDPETHLIPNVLRAARGEIPAVSVFGAAYPTRDGTAVRDYIHVADLAAAHVLALRYLRKGGEPEFLNLGTGRGYSVLEVIETARRVTGRPIPVQTEPARPGDVSELVASAEKAARVLGWKAERPELEEIIRSAWRWRERERNGE